MFRIRAHHDGAVLTATDDDLDELIGSVAAEANHEPNRRRQHRLDAAFDALNNAADSTAGEPDGPSQSLDIARVQRWCAARVPEHARHQVRVECQIAPRHLTIVERRAPWREDLGPEWTSFPIARLRYTAADKTWTLYWRDRNLRFHIYDLLAPSNQVEDILNELDPTPPASSGG